MAVKRRPVLQGSGNPSGLKAADADAIPVARGHTLIILRRHVGSIFDFPAPEQADVVAHLTRLRAQIQISLRPDACTIGINDGAAAVQTVEHAQAP